MEVRLAFPKKNVLLVLILVSITRAIETELVGEHLLVESNEPNKETQKVLISILHSYPTSGSHFIRKWYCSQYHGH
jgi:hypothetical protein